MRFKQHYIKTKNGTRALMIGRKRKVNALRDASGVSREHERLQRLDYEARLARRARDLVVDGIDPSNAPDRLSGFTLGRLLLRWRHRPHPTRTGAFSFPGRASGSHHHRHLRIVGTPALFPHAGA